MIHAQVRGVGRQAGLLGAKYLTLCLCSSILVECSNAGKRAVGHDCVHAL